MIPENEHDRHAYPEMDATGLTFEVRHDTQPDQTPTHLAYG